MTLVFEPAFIATTSFIEPLLELLDDEDDEDDEDDVEDELLEDEELLELEELELEELVEDEVDELLVPGADPPHAFSNKMLARVKLKLKKLRFILYSSFRNYFIFIIIIQIRSEYSSLISMSLSKD